VDSPRDVLDAKLIRQYLCGPNERHAPLPAIEPLRGRLNAEPGWKPTVPEIMPFVRLYRDKPRNAVGGCLRPMLSGNVRDIDIGADRDKAEGEGDADGVALCNALLRMSQTQRHRVCDLFDDDPATDGPVDEEPPTCDSGS
jgi:hypothetical protein